MAQKKKTGKAGLPKAPSKGTRGYQAGQREEALANIFSLLLGTRRQGIDATLTLRDGLQVDFELKSTEGDSVTSARDLDLKLIEKWRAAHWLIGSFSPGNLTRPNSVFYGSPEQMRAWLDEQCLYIAPDIKIAQLALSLVKSQRQLAQVLGRKSWYPKETAKLLLKRQKFLNADDGKPAEGSYVDRMNFPAKGLGAKGFTPDVMIGLVRERLTYLLWRGISRNNPHISASYLKTLTPIAKSDYNAAALQALVVEALDKARRTEEATA